MKRNLVIFGSGDLARLAHYYFGQDAKYKVVGFTLTADCIEEPEYLGLPVYPFEEIEKNCPPDTFEMFIAIGYTDMNALRTRFYHEAKAKGYRLASYKSPHATILSDDIGDNTFILEDNTIQPFVKIGNNVVLWSGNHVGHDAVIEDHCFITSHVVLSGRTHIKESSFIGVNATVRNNVTIGKACVIGAGSWIHKDTEDQSVYTTKPADLYHKASDQLAAL